MSTTQVEGHHPSHAVMISCGCVTVDPSTRQVAILRDSTKPAFTTLPKGRKNIGEDLLAAALREAYEETGLKVQPLPLKIATRATPTEDMALPLDSSVSASGGNPDVTAHEPNCEPSSVCSYQVGTGTFKLVFWFAAKGDSTAVPDEGTKEAWEEHMKVEWVDAREAAGMMSFPRDKKVIEKVLEDMRRTGYDI